MPREGTKAAEIMRLYSHAIYTVREIAEIVGCRPEYVRVVARQRREERYALGKGLVDVDETRSIARAAYKKARLDGVGVKEAQGLAGSARARFIIRAGVLAKKMESADAT